MTSLGLALIMQGADNKRMAAIYRTQFKLLMRWCLLMGLLCFAVLIFLITARGEITSMRGYIQVGTLMLQAGEVLVGHTNLMPSQGRRSADDCV